MQEIAKNSSPLDHPRSWKPRMAHGSQERGVVMASTKHNVIRKELVVVSHAHSQSFPTEAAGRNDLSRFEEHHDDEVGDMDLTDNTTAKIGAPT